MTRDYQQEIVDGILAAIEQGVAPWQKPWNADNIPSMPTNPTTGKEYRGVNVLWLTTVAQQKGFEDPRWCTYKQAQEHGWQVRRGEHGSIITFWKRTETIKQKDPDNNGERKVEVPLQRPIPFAATVFNAAQIQGMPVLEHQEATWNPVSRAENILNGSRAKIYYDGGDKAYYRIRTDTIHLPTRASFENAGDFYDTSLHELAHWTGHSSRLNRDFAYVRREDPIYAREELRAETASFVLALQIGLPHNEQSHASYLSHYFKLLKSDKYELFRAYRDAEKITDYLLTRELHRDHQAQQAHWDEPDGPVQEVVPGGQKLAAPVRYYEPPAQEADMEWGYER